MSGKLKVEQLLDIASPAAPPLPAYQDYLIAIAIMIAGLLALGLFIRRYYSRRQRARRDLVRLIRLVGRTADRVDSRYLAYRIAEILRGGLGLTRLTASSELPESLYAERRRWLSFISALDQARYALPVETRDRMLVREADFWLRKWPR